MIKALLFDLGDTVLAEESYDLAAGYSAISGQLIPEATFNDLSHAIKLSQNGPHEFSVLCWIQKYILKPEGLEQAREIELELWKKTVSLQPIEGIGNALYNLQCSGVRVGAISNAIFSANCISKELQKYDLLRYFEFIISSADFGFRKPNSEIFKLALQKINIAVENVSYVGDNFMADVVGSYKVGMTPILFGKQNNFKEKGIKYKYLSKWSELEYLLSQY